MFVEGRVGKTMFSNYILGMRVPDDMHSHRRPIRKVSFHVINYVLPNRIYVKNKMFFVFKFKIEEEHNDGFVPQFHTNENS